MGKAKKSRSSRQNAWVQNWRRYQNMGAQRERAPAGHGVYPFQTDISDSDLDIVDLADAVVASNFSRSSRRRFIRAYQREIDKKHLLPPIWEQNKGGNV